MRQGQRFCYSLAILSEQVAVVRGQTATDVVANGYPMTAECDDIAASSCRDLRTRQVVKGPLHVVRKYSPTARLG